MNTAPDQNSLEQLGYSPPLQHARDTVPIHKRPHRATLSRRHHRLLQQPAHKRLLLCHHAACPLHDTGTMPIELIPRENLSLLVRQTVMQYLLWSDTRPQVESASGEGSVFIRPISSRVLRIGLRDCLPESHNEVGTEGKWESLANTKSQRNRAG